VPPPIVGELASSLGGPMMGTLRVFRRNASCCHITLMLSWGEVAWAYLVGMKSRVQRQEEVF